VFVDHALGVLDRRPQLEKVLERLRPGHLMVWRLDRLGRSLLRAGDSVLDPGVGAVPGPELRELPDFGVGREGL